ncbi:MAG: Fic family protein [Methanomicrobiales archaeon]
MFNPQFIYTNKMVNYLLKIYSMRDFIANAPLVMNTKITLQRDALLKNVHHSTAIEGNILSLTEVKEISRGHELSAHKKAKQEVLNYLKVLKNLDKYHENGEINEKSLLKLFGDITYHTLDYAYFDVGYRTVPVNVVNNLNEVVFSPPPPDEIKALMDNLIKWINTSDDLNPIIKTGIAHFELVRIHPFVDGNGRTARALVTLMLYLDKFGVSQYFAMDEYYNQDRSAYYDALNSVNLDLIDLTPWLEYYLEGILYSISKVEDQIILSEPAENGKKIRLTDRQMKIMEYIHLNGSISNREVQKLFGISRQGAYKYLNKLVNQELLEKKGGSRSTYYVLLSNK